MGLFELKAVLRAHHFMSPPQPSEGLDGRPHRNRPSLPPDLAVIDVIRVFPSNQWLAPKASRAYLWTTIGSLDKTRELPTSSAVND